MKATVYFEQRGITFPALNNKQITGSSVNGLKRAFINAVNRSRNTLPLWFGAGSTVTATAWMQGANCPVFTYNIVLN